MLDNMTFPITVSDFITAFEQQRRRRMTRDERTFTENLVREINAAYFAGMQKDMRYPAHYVLELECSFDRAGLLRGCGSQRNRKQLEEIKKLITKAHALGCQKKEEIGNVGNKRI